MNVKPASLYRQGSWMMIASTLCSVFALATHFYGAWMGANQYGLFNTFLQMLNLALIPALPLQMMFCRQAASVVDEQSKRELAGTMQGTALIMLGIWSLMLVSSLVFHRDLSRIFQVENPVVIWCGLLAACPLLILPIFLGAVQGKEDYLAFGVSVILNGFGRFIAVGLLVGLLGLQAGGALFGVALGSGSALLLAMARSRDCWQIKGLKIDWKKWFSKLIPLALGLGSSQAMLAIDVILVRASFDKDYTGLYGAAGMFGRGIVLFLAPLVWVMFPKIVKQQVTREPSDALKQTLKFTAAAGFGMALSLTLFSWGSPPFLNWLLLNDYLPATAATWLEDNMDAVKTIFSLLPMFVWTMLPLTAANILINDLLAKGRVDVGPWLFLVPVTYAVVLSFTGTTAVRILATLFVFNLVLLGVAWLFRLKNEQ